MPELKEVFEMVTKQTEPDLDSWQEQERRQRKVARNRRVGAIAVVAAIVSALAIVALTRPGKDEATKVGADPTSPAPVSPSIGAQVIGLDGTVRERIPGMPGGASGLRLSPDGRTIAFTTIDGRVATIHRDGSGLKILTVDTANSGGDAQEAVSWSPDGGQIAYVAHDDIYVMDADGSNVLRLTDDPGGEFFPAWSSQGVIAYWHGATSGEDGGPSNSEIYTIPATGGIPTRLTHNGTPDIEPTWSPDGERIAYFSTEPSEIWVMNADGSDRHRLFGSKENEGWAPTWSPDGQSIAFLHCCSSSPYATLLEVRVLDLATGTVRRLHVDVATDLNGPSWSSSDALLINRY
jgi:Tol biopolymer transport system component